MTFTLQANRQITASRRLMLLSALTSAAICFAGNIHAQEPLKQPPAKLPSQRAQDSVPQITPEQIKQLEQEYEEGKFTPPGREELYRVDSEATKFERIRQLRKKLGRMDIDFPDEDAIRLKGTMAKRDFQPSHATVQASYVVYQPLYFQQINHERYGWELGVFQPIVSTAQFYGDVLLFPYKFAANPPWHCEANAGYALPGDPEPLRFLTTPFSWRGVAGETAVIIGGSAVFP